MDFLLMWQRQNFLTKEVIFMISTLLALGFLVGGFVTMDYKLFIVAALFAIASKIN